MKYPGKIPSVTDKQAPRAGGYSTGQVTPKIADRRIVKSGGRAEGLKRPSVTEGKTPAQVDYSKR